VSRKAKKDPARCPWEGRVEDFTTADQRAFVDALRAWLGLEPIEHHDGTLCPILRDRRARIGRTYPDADFEAACRGARIHGYPLRRNAPVRWY
jgi:hypothetical protein